jgi:hypothetical protein
LGSTSGAPSPVHPSSARWRKVGARASAMALSPTTVSRGSYVSVRLDSRGVPFRTVPRPLFDRR